jgi:hypothetical protein
MSIEIQSVKARHPYLYKLFAVIPWLITTSLLLIMVSGYGSFLLDDGKKYSILFIIALYVAILYFMRWLIRGFEYALFTILAIINLKNHETIDFWKILRSEQQQLSKKELLFHKKLPKHLANKDLVHWVILPMYNESADIIKETLSNLQKSQYDLSRIAVTIAWEERKKEHFLSVIDEVLPLYQSVFWYIDYNIHPKDLPGEMVGKGGNITHAAKQIYAKILSHFNCSPDKVMVTTLDADTNVSAQYFAMMSYTYLTQPDRKHKSYQPMIFFFNNFWDVPFFSKMVSMGNSFRVMFNAVKKYGTRNFSTHMQPLDALIELDFWSVQTIVEDGHQFRRSYFWFKGRYECIPVYTTVYQDANNNENIFKTALAQYSQMRRRSHGAEDIPYALCMRIDQKKELSFWRTLYEWGRLLEWILLWSTLHLVLLGGIGFSLVKDVEINTYISLGAFVGICMKFSYIIMTIVICMQLFFCPWHKLTKIGIIKELLWFMVLYIPLIGFILVIFSGAPAFHTQFALMINKPMKKFNVTDKVRKE